MRTILVLLWLPCVLCIPWFSLNGDGTLDAVTCGKEADGVAAWYANDGKSRFTKHVIGTGQGSYALRAVDMDMDGVGHLDVLIAGHASRNVVWFENPLK